MTPSEQCPICRVPLRPLARGQWLTPGESTDEWYECPTCGRKWWRPSGGELRESAIDGPKGGAG